MTDERVWTSRRALLAAPRGAWTPGRLRVSDRVLRFTAHDGTVTEVALEAVTAVRVTRLPHRVLVLETPSGPLRLRCFAVPAVAELLHGSGRDPDTPQR
ncbi:hypothetical protein [Amnibacterium kyonggiense]|uniref:PH (Pleckstrin Homology) domain-containing protein n=1 Tax=Amnibacterium kyonggiense TaxID=595671 RepID=A0A4R7FS82_9MICO|nr:hypothetical protein [Amnibacterium kyonggiense]TDS80598.1 hypothetical protein CLV52_1164 [Amnibacterium kyonggiense]